MRGLATTPIVWKNILFDSQEEMFVAMWLEELKDAGYVRTWTRKVSTIQITEGLKILYIKETQLKTKLKQENKFHTILRPSEYTPDFEVLWSIDGWGKFVNPTTQHKYSSLWSINKFLYATYWDKPMLIEVKPSFDQNNMERLFVLNQKFIWNKYKIFVNLVEPIELFKKTFLPSSAVPYFTYVRPPKGKKVGDYKFDWKPKTISEYLNEIK